MRTIRVLLSIVVASGLAGSIAQAATIDRVVVGVPGRNATTGFSPKLVVEVMAESGYRKVDFDGDHGDWLGPPYRSTTNSKLGGRSRASWTVYFDHGLTAQRAMASHFTHGWKRYQAAIIQVPHVVDRIRVATIKGRWLLTKGPGNTNAQFEGVLSFPLCRGVVVSAEFDFLEPSTLVDGLGGQFRVFPGVGDKDAFSWNRGAAILAPAHVALDGYLQAATIGNAPIARTASDPHHELAGVVRDCSGAPMPAVAVHVGTLSARTDSRGIFALHVPGPGDYRVTATAGGGTVQRLVHVT